MNLESWIEKYRPLKNHLNEDASYGFAFETFGEELEFVSKHSVQNIWTMVEEEGEFFITPNYYLADRIFYFITEIKWENPYLIIEIK